MARIPALVNTIARVDGRPRATLDLIARNVREAGLIATTRRGEGAAHMQVTDAAAFLIGANAVQSPALAARAVQDFRSLKQTPHGRSAASGWFGETFAPIAACDTFGEALEALIQQAEPIYLLFHVWTEQAFGKGADVMLLGPSLRVVFHACSAEITVHAPGADGLPHLKHQFLFLADVDRMTEYTRLDQSTDRQVTTSIGLRTVLAVHDCIFDLIRDPTEDNA